jgi:hypothetical protein
MIKTSNFVKRQTRTSDYSYFNGSWDELEAIVTSNIILHNYKEGYREGVNLVQIPENLLHRFFTAVVPIEEVTSFDTIVEARREGELKYKKNISYGIKKPAQSAFVVIYSKKVLEEDPLNTDLTGADWEIISINCSPYKDKELPMIPLAMARNELADTELGKGGTKGSYTPKQFAEAIIFWNTHSLIREKE